MFATTTAAYVVTKAQPLADRPPIGQPGILLGAKGKDLGVLTFVAPAAGRYVVSVKSAGVRVWGRHGQIALNVVHFSGASGAGRSIAFGKTNVTDKANLDLLATVQLRAGDEVAFQVDTDAEGGGGGAYWQGLDVRLGRFAEP